MALVVFLRGVNVGGHKTFQPSVLARELADFDVVNIGAAGTFVVRKPISQAQLRTEFLLRLPVKAEIMICPGRDITNLVDSDPFVNEPSGPDVVRFISVLAKRLRVPPPVPLNLPPGDEWLVKILAVRARFAFGMYRRHMRTITYLGQVEKRLGVSATTRNWNTINAIVKVLKGGGIK
ncbi:MAG TPA: hypothetical protein VLE20_15965 [Blastocatellia bacterium]|nr:hypothetical protein [Blastocatellia bacterium]